MNKEWMMGLGLAGLGLATGGLGLLPGLMGGAGAAGGAAGAAGASGAASGLGGAALGGEAAFGALANPYTSPEFIAQAAASSTGGPVGGLLSQLGGAAGTASKFAPMAGLALNAAEKGGLMGGGQAPIQPGQLPQFQPIGGTDGGLADLQQKRMKRQGLFDMGGGNGFA